MTTSKIAAGAARSTVRKWVLGALAAGVVTTAIGAGTFASFSASTNNDDNVFSTGSVELSNTKESGTTCVSGHTGPGGAPQADLDANDNDCDTLMDLTLRSPGDTAEGHVALANTGDYDGLLQFFVNGAGCANATVATPAGTGSLCDKLEVYIQETNSAYTVPTATCVFPFNASGACASDFSAATDSLTDLATHAPPTAAKPTTPVTLDIGATKYYVVRVNFRDGAFDVNGNGVDNEYQNRSASFGLTWRLQEA